MCGDDHSLAAESLSRCFDQGPHSYRVPQWANRKYNTTTISDFERLQLPTTDHSIHYDDDDFQRRCLPLMECEHSDHIRGPPTVCVWELLYLGAKVSTRSRARLIHQHTPFLLLSKLPSSPFPSCCQRRYRPLLLL